MSKRIQTTLATLAVTMLCLSTAPVFAESGTSGSNDSNEAKTTAVENARTENTSTETHKFAAAVAEKEQEAKDKAEAAKEKACTNRKTAVTNIESRIAERGQRQLDTFTKIAQRTEEFYSTKGYSLSNYDALVSDVNAKQAAAKTAVATIKADSQTVTSVTCTNGDGKAKVESFKKDLRSEQTALKNYKTAIRNLIVAVKSAPSTTAGTNNQTGGGQ